MAHDARTPARVLVSRKRPIRPGEIVFIPKTKIAIGVARECWFHKGQFLVLVQQSNAGRRRKTCES